MMKSTEMISRYGIPTSSSSTPPNQDQVRPCDRFRLEHSRGRDHPDPRWPHHKREFHTRCVANTHRQLLHSFHFSIHTALSRGWDGLSSRKAKRRAGTAAFQPPRVEKV